MTGTRKPDHNSPDPQFDYALSAMRAMAWADAAALFQQYLITNPDSEVAWANLSFAYRGLGDSARQLRAARRANKLDPDGYGTLLALGEALLYSGLYAEALASSQRAQKLFPKAGPFVEITARAFDHLGQPKKAMAAARKAIGVSQFFNILMHVVVAKSLRNLGRFDKAIKEYDRIIGNESPIPVSVGADPKQEALTGKATTLLLKALQQGEDPAWREARDGGHKALERDPRDDRALAVVGVAHRHLAEFELSLDYLQRAIDAGATDEYLSLQRGMTLHELGRYEESLADLDFAATKATDDAVRHEALTYRPLPLAQLGRLDDTLRACDEAIAAGVDNAIIRNTRALVYLTRDTNLEAAETELAKASQQAPDDPVVLTNLGWVAIQRDEFGKADEFLDRAIRIAEQFSWRWGAWKIWVTKYLSLAVQGKDEMVDDHIERMREALKSFPGIIKRVLHEIELVTLQRELALAGSRIQELEASVAYASAAALPLDSYRRRVASLEDLLAKEGVVEEEVKQFLKSEASRFIFGLECVRVRTEHELGDDFKADFVLEYPARRYVFVEIENPRHKLYTQSGNPRAALTHARQQVEDWQQWVEEHNSYAQTKLPGCTSPEGLVVIGRRSTLSEEDSRRLQRTNTNNRGRVLVITYDDLLESARAVIKNLEASEAAKPR